MGKNELRKALEKADDKLSIFGEPEIFNKCRLYGEVLEDLICDFLNDEEKNKLFDYNHFKQLKPRQIKKIIMTVSDDNIRLKIITRDDIDISIDELIDILGDKAKQQILHNQDFIEKHKITPYYLTEIITSLTEKARMEILLDVDFIKNKLHLYDENIIDILKTLDIKTLIDFIVTHKDFLREWKIFPYEIVFKLDIERQQEIAENLENLGLSLSEKRKILVVLKPNVKQQLDTANFPEEYKSALSMQIESYMPKIILDLERDLEEYRGLDSLIYVNPVKFTEQQRDKFIKLGKICPNLTVTNTSKSGFPVRSSAKEYKEAEEWINSVMKSLKPEYSVAQKIAVIDNAIGKRISFSPDFDTEVFNNSDCRALWRIISSGYGTCEGVALIEQYIFNRIGIESEIIASKVHVFLKIRNIELTLASGEIVKGDTILDPTWNLSNHRFGGKPNNFFINYEMARKNDIDKNGVDQECHRSEKLEGIDLIYLDEQSLRDLFKSVGLTDKEGQFPMQHIIEQSKMIDENYADMPEQNINKQLLLLKELYPEFATCQDSTMSMLNVLLNNKNLKCYKRGVNRVYNKEDKKKTPIIYVYIELNEHERKFYVANKEESQFMEVTETTFIKQFACYDEDLKRDKQEKPWDKKEEVADNSQDTSDGKRSSGGEEK